MDKYIQDFGPVFIEHLANTVFRMIRVDEGTFIMGHTYDQFDSEVDLYYRENYIWGTIEQKRTDHWGFSTRPHPVTVPCFYISDVPVTREQWKAVMGNAPDDSVICDDTPIQVYPKDARIFLNRISALSGHHHFLPTEEQWEYAARGGCRSKGYRYSGSSRHDDVCLKDEHDDNPTLSPVKQFPPNELGIYAMTTLCGELCMRTHKEFPDYWEVAPLPEKEIELIRRGSYSTSFYDFADERDKYAFRFVLRLKRTSQILVPRINFRHMIEFWQGRNGIIYELHSEQIKNPSIRKQAKGVKLPPGNRFSEQIGSVKFDMVRIEGSTFQLPNHKCTVTLKDYYLSTTPVTQELWDIVMGVGFDRSTIRSQHYPVNNVRLSDCRTFLRRLKKLTGRRYVLPSSAQWYWASLGGKLSKGYHYIESDIKEEMSLYANWDHKPHQIAITKPNELGLFDMADNVCVWLADGEEPLPEDEGHYTDPVWYNNNIFYHMSTDNGSTDCEPAPSIGFSYPTNLLDNGIRLALEP